MSKVIAFTLVKGRTITTVKELDTKRFHTTLTLKSGKLSQVVAHYNTKIEAHTGHLNLVDYYIGKL